jgi:hypothetical protein
LLRTGFYTFLAAGAFFGMVYAGVFMKYNIYFTDYTIKTGVNTFPACLA